jgi:hypothetical protein
MSFVQQFSAVMILVDFLFGVLFGVVGSASLASRREDRDYSLLHAPQDPLCDGARVIHGVYVRGDGFVSNARRQLAHADDARHAEGSDADGQEPER